MKTRMKWAPKRVQGFESHTYLSPYLHLRSSPAFQTPQGCQQTHGGQAVGVPTKAFHGDVSSGKTKGYQGTIGWFPVVSLTMYPWHLDGVLGWDSCGFLVRATSNYLLRVNSWRNFVPQICFVAGMNESWWDDFFHLKISVAFVGSFCSNGFLKFKWDVCVVWLGLSYYYDIIKLQELLI